MAKFEYYQGSDNLWYWRLRDGNIKIVADGSEGYVSKSNVLRAIDNVIDTVVEIARRQQ